MRRLSLEPPSPSLPLFSQRCLGPGESWHATPGGGNAASCRSRGPGQSDSEGPVEVTWSSAIVQIGTLWESIWECRSWGQQRDLPHLLQWRPSGPERGSDLPQITQVVSVRARPSTGASSFPSRGPSVAPRSSPSPELIHPLPGGEQHKTMLPHRRLHTSLPCSETFLAMGCARVRARAHSPPLVPRARAPGRQQAKLLGLSDH